MQGAAKPECFVEAEVQQELSVEAGVQSESCFGWSQSEPLADSEAQYEPCFEGFVEAEVVVGTKAAATQTATHAKAVAAAPEKKFQDLLMAAALAKAIAAAHEATAALEQPAITDVAAEQARQTHQNLNFGWLLIALILIVLLLGGESEPQNPMVLSDLYYARHDGTFHGRPLLCSSTCENESFPDWLDWFC